MHQKRKEPKAHDDDPFASFVSPSDGVLLTLKFRFEESLRAFQRKKNHAVAKESERERRETNGKRQEKKGKGDNRPPN
ncbi:hypothetical protein Trydic_g20191 [Trypoxylus dichotomus]